MKHVPALALVLLLTVCVTTATYAQAETVDFNRYIRPIFIRHCTECHGGVKQAGDLSLVYEESVSDLVEAGQPDDSELLRRLLSDDDDERMPPPDHGPPLSPDTIQLVKTWIEQGAKWGKHWAYEIPRRHDRPQVSDENWSAQPIDFFVLSRLDANRIKPASDEIPERWLRRVSLDLVGLPPTLQMRTEFLNDLRTNGASAYESVVDKLLASTSFGERWASVWFDQVRYADSRGMGADGRRTIWKYRDWVIEAFNDDMPYDQFTLKQIAGDLLPDATISDRVATAVHRLTQSNEEGGTDDEEFRIEAVLDRVTTTWQTWQGTTIGCVQCHHHPYDPFTHEDFYRSVAYFNNTADCDLNDDWPLQRVPLETADLQRASALDAQINDLREKIWRGQSDVVSNDQHWQEIKRLTVSGGTEMKVETKDDHAEYYTVGTVPTGLQYSLEIPLEAAVKQLTAIRIHALPKNPQTAIADSEWGFVLSQLKAELLIEGADKPTPIEFLTVVGDDPDPRYDPRKSLDKSNEGFSAFTRIHHPRLAAFVLKKPIEIAAGSTLRMTFVQKIASGGSHPLVIKRGHIDVSQDASLIDNVSAPDLAEQQRQLAELEKEFAAIKSTTVPVMRERSGLLKRPTHVFDRGNFLTKGKSVQPGMPTSLLPEGMQVKNRLELAEWFIDAENPLTARVAVNRFWARIFGAGLVLTEEDFGSTGTAPTHPALLDDLAVRFREDYQWSVKRLLREIVLSRTYRQSARTREDLLEKNQANRLLARGPRNALDAEIVRDQALAISGLLDDTMYGPPVHPPLPAGVWKPFSGGDKWPTTEAGDPERYRRSIYTYIKRSIPYPMFAAFDTPTREFCAPRRLRSNTPLQPLSTMNDEAIVECRDALAARMQQHHEDVQQQIEFGFLLAASRDATDSESAALLQLHKNITGKSDAAVALKSVAAVLLNLDEVLTQ